MPNPSRSGKTFIALSLLLGGGIGRADVVAVVSARSAITSLSKIQIGEIFLGKPNHLLDGQLVAPIDRSEGSLRDEFYLKFTGKSPAQLRAHWSKIIFTGRGQPPPSVSNSIEMKKRIAASPVAIGYIEQNLVDNSVRVLALP